MAMTIGTCTLNATTGVVTTTPGSYAEAEFDALLAPIADAYAAAGQSLPVGPALGQMLKGVVVQVDSGVRLLNYIVANAEVDLGTGAIS